MYFVGFEQVVVFVVFGVDELDFGEAVIIVDGAFEVDAVGEDGVGLTDDGDIGVLVGDDVDVVFEGVGRNAELVVVGDGVSEGASCDFGDFEDAFFGFYGFFFIVDDELEVVGIAGIERPGDLSAVGDGGVTVVVDGFIVFVEICGVVERHGETYDDGFGEYAEGVFGSCDFVGIDVEFGVRLEVFEGVGEVDGVLQAGDVVTELDGQIISRQTELVNMLNEKTKGEEVELVIERDNELITKKVTLKEIPNSKGRIGLGITFAESKSIRTNPDVNADTEKIGGPSAGLMFTLEILNQLLEEDISKGYTIAGTGELEERKNESNI